MDAKKSASAVNSVLARALKQNGFTKKGSKWWKKKESAIFFVARKNARWIHPSAFSIILAVCLRCIPAKRFRTWDEYLPPDESECQFTKYLLDPTQSTEGQPHIWTFDNDGINLGNILAGVDAEMRRDGLPWFENLSSREGAFNEMYEKSDSDFGTHGWGSWKSPAYFFLLGFIALELGRKEIALECFDELMKLDEKHFWHSQDLIRKDYKLLKNDLAK